MSYFLCPFRAASRTWAAKLPASYHITANNNMPYISQIITEKETCYSKGWPKTPLLFREEDAAYYDSYSLLDITPMRSRWSKSITDYMIGSYVDIDYYFPQPVRHSAT